MQRAATFMALFGGIAAALGHAPFHFWLVAVAGFAAIIWSVSAAPTQRSAFRTGWLAGAAYFAVTLHWIVEPFLVDAATHGWMAPFALVLMAGGLALFWGLAGWLSARIAGRRPARAFAFALLLTGAEMVRGHIFTGFPWVLPAYVWADTPVRLTAALWGPYGLSLVTLLLAALPSMVSRKPAIVALSITALLGFAGLAGIGLLREGRDYAAAAPVVRIIQPNVPQDEKWDPDKAASNLRRTLGYTGERTERNKKLIVWPESAIPYVLDMAGPVVEAVADAAGGVPVISGINRRSDGDWFNSLILIDPGGDVSQTYDKVHLVPFGEYIPYRIDFLRAMAAMSNYGFSKGEEVRLIDTPIGRALPLICYEAIFPGHGRGLDARPDYLLQITNDAWFGTWSGPYQHLDQARFRAVEHGLPLVRAANTGISAMIDARGEVRASLPLGHAGYVEAQLPAALAPTLYSRTGDRPLIVLLFVALTVLAFLNRRNTIANGPPSS